MNVNGIGAVGYPVREHTTGKAKKNVTSGSAGFIETVVEKGESVVDQYKRKHPEDVSHGCTGTGRKVCNSKERRGQCFQKRYDDGGI